MSKNPKALVTLANLRASSGGGVKLADPANLNSGDAKLAPAAHLDSLIQRANEQYQAIKDGDRTTALRAVFLGLLFWQIKNEAGHGNFMKLASERMPSIPQRTRNELMKLAVAYVEKTRVALPQRLTIPDAQLALLDTNEGTDAEMIRKAIDFVGSLSLHELMIKHDIRAVGLKKELGDQSEGESEEGTLPPEEVLRRKREEIFGQTAEHLTHLRKTLTNTEQLALLQPDQIDVIKREIGELKAALDQIESSKS